MTGSVARLARVSGARGSKTKLPRGRAQPDRIGLAARRSLGFYRLLTQGLHDCAPQKLEDSHTVLARKLYS